MHSYKISPMSEYRIWPYKQKCLYFHCLRINKLREFPLSYDKKAISLYYDTMKYKGFDGQIYWDHDVIIRRYIELANMHTRNKISTYRGLREKTLYERAIKEE